MIDVVMRREILKRYIDEILAHEVFAQQRVVFFHHLFVKRYFVAIALVLATVTAVIASDLLFSPVVYAQEGRSEKVFRGQLSRGEMLVTALKRERVNGESIHGATQRIGQIFDFRLSRAGDVYEYVIKPASNRRMQWLRYHRGSRVYEARLTSEGYVSKVLSKKVVEVKDVEAVIADDKPSSVDTASVEGTVDGGKADAGKGLQIEEMPLEVANAGDATAIVEAVPSDGGDVQPRMEPQVAPLDQGGKIPSGLPSAQVPFESPEATEQGPGVVAVGTPEPTAKDLRLQALPSPDEGGGAVAMGDASGEVQRGDSVGQIDENSANPLLDFGDPLAGKVDGVSEAMAKSEAVDAADSSADVQKSDRHFLLSDQGASTVATVSQEGTVDLPMRYFKVILILSFLALLMSAGVVVYFVRKASAFRRVTRHFEGLSVECIARLGDQQSVVLIRSQERAFLLAIGGELMMLIAEIDDPGQASQLRYDAKDKTYWHQIVGKPMKAEALAALLTEAVDDE